MAEARPSTSVTPELSVVLFNVHSSDTKVKAADRQHCLREVMDGVLAEGYPDPLFVLCQEGINGPKHKIVCEKLGQTPSSIRCQAEAGVYYRPDPSGRHEVRYVDASTLRRTDDGIGLQPNVPFETGRLMACVLTTPCSDSKKILLVSWHGPETKAKKNVDLKCNCFRRLVRFSERLREDESCDSVLIGGDFNLPAQNARQVLDTFRKDGSVDGSVLDQYTPPADRKGLAIKDYVVYWPPHQLHNVHTEVIRPDYRREKGSRPFDHPIVGYTFGNLPSKATTRGADKVTSTVPKTPALGADKVTPKATVQRADKVTSEEPEATALIADKVTPTVPEE